MAGKIFDVKKIKTSRLRTLALYLAERPDGKASFKTNAELVMAFLNDIELLAKEAEV